MSFSREQLDALAHDDEFAARVRLDSVLNAAWGSKDLSPNDERNELAAFLGGALSFASGISVPLLTAGAAAILWQTRNPFLCGGVPAQDDIDTFFFVCVKGRAALALDDLAASARGTCKALGVDYAEAASIAEASVEMAFAAFKCLPDDGSRNAVGGPVAFDAWYLARVVAVVHKLTGADDDKALWRMPLAAVNWYLLANMEANGARNIQRRNRAQEVKDRLDEMMRKRLAERSLGI
jgi:hypothetical protein